MNNEKINTNKNRRYNYRLFFHSNTNIFNLSPIKQNTMDLDIIKLAPYLPYKLKLVARNVVSNTPRRIYGEMNAMNIMSLVENDTLYKPILKPISDLKYKSSSELKSFYGINDEIIFWIQELTEKNTEIKYITLETYTFLMQYHFDLFNLINDGLAISIHDVE